VKYPYCSNFFLLPVCVLLITHNWFYSLLWMVWIANAVVSVYEEDVLFNDLFGTDPDYEYRVDITVPDRDSLNELQNEEHEDITNDDEAIGLVLLILWLSSFFLLRFKDPRMDPVLLLLLCLWLVPVEVIWLKG